MERIPLKKCRAILEKDGSQYTDQEILEIREVLYKFAELELSVYEKMKKQEEKNPPKKEVLNCSPCGLPSFLK